MDDCFHLKKEIENELTFPPSLFLVETPFLALPFRSQKT
jgi:hypothetical protein